MTSFTKDPNSVEPYYIIWCSSDNTNDGTTSDTGRLQGATISSDSWTVPSDITEDSSNNSSVTIQGITYSANTVSCIWLSSGTDGASYNITNQIVTSDSRTLDQTITIVVGNV